MHKQIINNQGKNFSVDEESYSKICRIVGDILNKQLYLLIKGEKSWTNGQRINLPVNLTISSPIISDKQIHYTLLEHELAHILFQSDERNHTKHISPSGATNIAGFVALTTRAVIFLPAVCPRLAKLTPSVPHPLSEQSHPDVRQTVDTLPARSCTDCVHRRTRTFRSACIRFRLCPSRPSFGYYFVLFSSIRFSALSCDVLDGKIVLCYNERGNAT